MALQGESDCVVSSSASVLTFPPEIIIRIASYLTTPELGNLRRSCKTIENHLFRPFAHEFFTKRQFMLEAHSLQALVDIANHPNLARHLTHVIVAGECINTALTLPGPGIPDRIDPEVLIWTGQARDMLAEAFRQLPNLTTVGLRDYAAIGRRRDGPDRRWRSYGWSVGSFADDVRLDRRCRPITHANSRTLPLVLSALAAARLTGLTCIQVLFRHSTGLDSESFSVLSGPMRASILPILNNLTELFLVLKSELLHKRRERPVPVSTLGVHLNCFFNATSNLRFLRINFDNTIDSASPFLDWLGMPVETSPVSSVALPNLTALEIGTGCAFPEDLLAIFTKFRLQHFGLWEIALLEEGSDGMMRQDCVADFFEKLSASLPNDNELKSIMIGNIRYKCRRETPDPTRHRYINDRPATFAPGEHDDHALSLSKDRLRKVEYRRCPGLDAKQWLHGLARRVSVAEEHMP